MTAAQWTQRPASETRTCRLFGYVLSVRPSLIGQGRWHWAVVYTLTNAIVETGTRDALVNARMAAEAAWGRHEEMLRARDAAAEMC